MIFRSTANLKDVCIAIGACLVVLVGLCRMGHAAELKSGLQVGQATQAFTVMDVTGPSKGNSLCYR